MDSYPDRWGIFEWDERKRALNTDKHGIDFDDIRQAFDGRPRIDGPSGSSTPGSERRHVSIAEIHGVVVAVVWTWRDEAIRVISARVARREERRRFWDIFHGRHRLDDSGAPER